MYRGEFWQRERREAEKAEKRNRWYEKGGYETAMFIDATPNGELAAECKKALKSSELKIRVVERSGQSLRSILSKSDPFQNDSCGKDTCKLNKLQNEGCRVQNEMPRLCRKRPKRRNVYWRNGKKHWRESK